MSKRKCLVIVDGSVVEKSTNGHSSRGNEIINEALLSMVKRRAFPFNSLTESVESVGFWWRK